MLDRQCFSHGDILEYLLEYFLVIFTPGTLLILSASRRACTLHGDPQLHGNGLH